MRKIILFTIVGVAALVGCREQITKFVFEDAKITHRSNYSYKYDGQRVKQRTERNYAILEGMNDSMVIVTDYIYNEKGLLIQENTATIDDESGPDMKFYTYDANDSIVCELTINSDNDTTLRTEYKCFPDGRKMTFQRRLAPQIDFNISLIDFAKNKQYDTLYYHNEYDYSGDLCKAEKHFDRHGNMKNAIRFEYKDGRLHKEVYFSFPMGARLKIKEKFYDYSKSEVKPDFYSIDAKNDTMDLGVNVFQDGLLVYSTVAYGYGGLVNKTFYEENSKVGEITVSNNMKVVEGFEYYENGDLKEERHYMEE